MIILEGKNISKHFGGLKAVNNVDMSVKKGEIFGVIGPNGAGKTTFFNVCTGNYQATAGEVFFRGEEITNMKPEEVAKQGMARTFQNIKLFNNMSVLENVKIGFHIHTSTNIWDSIMRSKKYKRDEKFVYEEGLKILEMVGLREYKDVKAGNLAYGTQRRLEIARALAMNPQILLLDEPAAGMNPNETMELLTFIKKLNSMGLTIVVIEHDMKFIMNVCDRVMVLNFGEKLFEGTPEEVKDDKRVVEAYFGKSINV